MTGKRSGCCLSLAGGGSWGQASHTGRRPRGAELTQAPSVPALLTLCFLAGRLQALLPVTMCIKFPRGPGPSCVGAAQGAGT